jgi:hypothetical protein
MKRVILVLVVMFGLSAGIQAQVRIGGTDNPDASAVLDLNLNATDNTNLGLLLPRVALTGINDNATVSSPATGLMVFHTGTAGFTSAGAYVWTGTQWAKYEERPDYAIGLSLTAE